MPREIKFAIGKQEFSATPVKVNRQKLYGWTSLMAVDDTGDPCELLTADESGKYIIPLGGTGMGILSASGKWVDRSELKTVYADGKPAELYKSSFDRVNLLQDEIQPEEFLNYSITDFYLLSDVPAGIIERIGERIFIFEYSYNDSYDPSPAFIMAADNTLFLMVGLKNVFEFLCFGDCETIDDDHDDRLIEDSDDEIDFSMF